jgi:hypothetical protein
MSAMAGPSCRVKGLVVLLLPLVGVVLPTPFAVQNSPRWLPVTLVRIVGYSIGYDMQGHFQLVVQGPVNLTHVEIHFNATLVYNTTAVQFAWSFDTDAYPLGWTNITVLGWDSAATLYQWSQLRRFVPPGMDTPYWIVAIVFLVVFFGLVVALKLRRVR